MGTWRPRNAPEARRGEPSLRFQKKKAAVLAVALGMVGVLVTALPAFAAADTVTGFTPVCGVVGTSVTITGTGFTGTRTQQRP